MRTEGHLDLFNIDRQELNAELEDFLRKLSLFIVVDAGPAFVFGLADLDITRQVIDDFGIDKFHEALKHRAGIIEVLRVF